MLIKKTFSLRIDTYRNHHQYDWIEALLFHFTPWMFIIVVKVSLCFCIFLPCAVNAAIMICHKQGKHKWSDAYGQWEWRSLTMLQNLFCKNQESKENFLNPKNWLPNRKMLQHVSWNRKSSVHLKSRVKARWWIRFWSKISLWIKEWFCNKGYRKNGTVGV